MINSLNSSQNIIEILGYAKSNNLFYTDRIDECVFLSFHIKKVLKELHPIAFYCVNNNPFVLFFENINDADEIKELHKKIWNSQIPIIIFNCKNEIKVYNGSKLLEQDKELMFIESISVNDCNDMANFSYWKITNTGFWTDFSKKFTEKNLYDTLLNNLKYITNKLKTVYKISFATKLLLRLIFIRFLIDRGVDISFDGLTSDIEKSKKRFLEIVGNRNSLYKLFNYLKVKFNGNLFETIDEDGSDSIPANVLKEIQDFFAGNVELSSGQLCLFPLYDFNIIPVELISNIYEVLLGKETQIKEKAFYTPHFLVNYIVYNTLEEHIKAKNSFKVLDPSCGSGIFLVEMLRQIIEKDVNIEGYVSDDNQLVEILKKNIYGVDINKDAIDVTIFSLYLTLLDYKDPKTLNITLPNLLNTNLIISDFFDDSKTQPLRDISFDFIIGNPPWGEIKDGYHLSYCYENKLQKDEISKAFVIKTKEFSSIDTVCCFVLPSKILYNTRPRSENYRKKLLKELKLLSIIEFSAVRTLMFKNAIAPAMVMSFKHGDNYLNNKIKHIAFKPNTFFRLFNVIVKEKNDTKFVSQKLLLENDWAWKVLVYGTAYDFQIIEEIKRLYKDETLRSFITRNALLDGTGIEASEGKYDISHLIDTPVYTGSSVDHFVLNEFPKVYLENRCVNRIRNKYLFVPPYCLVRGGMNIANYKIRAVYLESEILYKKAIKGIKGTFDQKKILLGLTGLMNSSLYAYLSLMLGSSVGIEREAAIFDDIDKFPVLINDDISERVEKIQQIKNHSELFTLKDAEKEIADLDYKILELFGLQDNPFVDYALNIQIPELTESKRNLRIEIADETILQNYAAVFSEYWNKQANQDGEFTKINIYRNICNKYNVFEMIFSDKLNDNLLEFVNDSQNLTADMLTRFMIHKTNDLFYDIKDVINFEDTSFFIIKTNERKNWHPAMAHIDLADVLSSILSKNEEE